MQPFILKTDGGPHTPQQWAMATAMTLMPIDPSIVDSRLMAAQKLQVSIAESLVEHHSTVQESERAALAEKGDTRLTEDLGHQDAVDAAMSHIVAAAAGTQWESHVNDPAVQEGMRRVLHEHFATVQHIERSWYKDRKTGA